PEIQHLLLPRLSCFLLVRRAERALALFNRQQSRIELDKRGIHRGMGGVAAIALGLDGDHLGGLGVVKAKEGPLAGETRFVFHVYFNAHYVCALVVAALVDRTFTLRAAYFEHQHGLVWPSAGLDERLVS